MSATIIDGKKISDDIRNELKQDIYDLKNKGITPGLATILIGDNPASQIYVKMKVKACNKLGIHTESDIRSSDITEQELIKIISKYAQDDKIHGILVQLPLPKHINEKKIINTIPIEKDVDGFHPINIGKLMLGEEGFQPCTPAGILEMLQRSGHSPEGKHVVVLGRSHIVGLPVANMLMHKKEGANATVTVCHTGSKDLKYFTKQADILIAAMGRPEMVTGEMVKEGVVLIDVGVNRVKDSKQKKGYKVVGDIERQSVDNKAKALSPVPGGVGPMTITMLLKNTIKSAKNINRSRQ